MVRSSAVAFMLDLRGTARDSFRELTELAFSVPESLDS